MDRPHQSRPYQQCGVDTEFPYGLSFLKKSALAGQLRLRFRVAPAVDTEFRYRVRIVDMVFIAATLSADTISDAQNQGEPL